MNWNCFHWWILRTGWFLRGFQVQKWLRNWKNEDDGIYRNLTKFGGISTHVKISPIEDILLAVRLFSENPIIFGWYPGNSGIIYRAVTRRGPNKLWKFFTLDTVARRSSPRWNFHRYQVADTYRSLHRDYVNRSTLGYVAIFNLLPDVVFVFDDEKLPISVQSFQTNLTRLLRVAIDGE